MTYLWDYDRKKLEKSEKGRMIIMERKLNYGPGDEKVSLSEVKKYWKKLELNNLAKRLFELLLWGKYQSSPISKKSFWIK